MSDKTSNNLFVIIAQHMNITRPDPNNINWRVRTEKIIDVQLGIEVVFLSIYIYVIYVLLVTKQKLFRSSFYILFIIGGFNDIPIAIAVEFTRQVKNIGLCYEHEMLIRIGFIITGTNYIFHFLINILITLNRLTSVALPIAHKTIWRARHLAIAVIIIAGIAIWSYSDIFDRPRLFYVKDDLCFQRNNYTMKTVIASAVAVVTFEIDCVIISPITIYLIYKAKKNLQMNTGIVRKKTEISLAFFALIKAILYSFDFVYEIQSLIPLPVANLWFFQMIRDQFMAYFFALMVSNGVIILILSGELRAEIKKRWGWNKSQVSPVTILNPSDVPSSVY